MSIDPTFTPEVIEAFAEARRLIAAHGQEHPLALRAIIHAINLADPGFADRTMAECGIALPEATHCGPDGSPLYSLEQIAQAMKQPVQDVALKVAELEQDGVRLAHTGFAVARH